MFIALCRFQREQALSRLYPSFRIYGKFNLQQAWITDQLYCVIICTANLKIHIKMNYMHMTVYYEFMSVNEDKLFWITVFIDCE